MSSVLPPRQQAHCCSSAASGMPCSIRSWVLLPTGPIPDGGSSGPGCSGRQSPLRCCFVLAFTTPDFASTGKLVYAYITYILLMTVYSVNNLPYSALNGVMTGDVNERTSLSSYRFFFAMAAAFVVQGLTLPMVAKLGEGNAAKGWQLTIGVFAVLSVVFFVITFFSARERIHPDPTQKSSPKQDFADLLKNGPWISMFVLTLFLFITLALWGSAMFYYFTYYVDKDRSLRIPRSWGLVVHADK